MVQCIKTTRFSNFEYPNVRLFFIFIFPINIHEFWTNIFHLLLTLFFYLPHLSSISPVFVTTQQIRRTTGGQTVHNWSANEVPSGGHSARQLFLPPLETCRQPVLVDQRCAGRYSNKSVLLPFFPPSYFEFETVTRNLFGKKTRPRHDFDWIRTPVKGINWTFFLWNRSGSWWGVRQFPTGRQIRVARPANLGNTQIKLTSPQLSGLWGVKLSSEWMLWKSVRTKFWSGAHPREGLVRELNLNSGFTILVNNCLEVHSLSFIKRTHPYGSDSHESISKPKELSTFYSHTSSIGWQPGCVQHSTWNALSPTRIHQAHKAQKLDSKPI